MDPANAVQALCEAVERLATINEGHLRRLHESLPPLSKMLCMDRDGDALGDILTVGRRGHGNISELTAWRVAELRHSGEDPAAHVRTFAQRVDGAIHMTLRVLRGDGREETWNGTVCAIDGTEGPPPIPSATSDATPDTPVAVDKLDSKRVGETITGLPTKERIAEIREWSGIGPTGAMIRDLLAAYDAAYTLGRRFAQMDGARAECNECADLIQARASQARIDGWDAIADALLAAAAKIRMRHGGSTRRPGE